MSGHLKCLDILSVMSSVQSDMSGVHLDMSDIQVVMSRHDRLHIGHTRVCPDISGHVRTCLVMSGHSANPTLAVKCKVAQVSTKQNQGTKSEVDCVFFARL